MLESVTPKTFELWRNISSKDSKKETVERSEPSHNIYKNFRVYYTAQAEPDRTAATDTHISNKKRSRNSPSWHEKWEIKEMNAI